MLQITDTKPATKVQLRKRLACLGLYGREELNHDIDGICVGLRIQQLRPDVAVDAPQVNPWQCQRFFDRFEG